MRKLRLMIALTATAVALTIPSLSVFADEPVKPIVVYEDDQSAVLAFSGHVASKAQAIPQLTARAKEISASKRSGWDKAGPKLQNAIKSQLGYVPSYLHIDAPLSGWQNMSGYNEQLYGNGNVHVDYNTDVYSDYGLVDLYGSSDTVWTGTSPQYNASSIRLVDQFTLSGTSQGGWNPPPGWNVSGLLTYHDTSVHDVWSVGNSWSDLAGWWGPLPAAVLTETGDGWAFFGSTGDTIHVRSQSNISVGP